METGGRGQFHLGERESHHLLDQRWLQRYRGELNEPQDVENKGTFKSDATDWTATLEKLGMVMDEWRERLGTIDEAKLESPVKRAIPGAVAVASCPPEYPQCLPYRPDPSTSKTSGQLEPGKRRILAQFGLASRPSVGNQFVRNSTHYFRDLGSLLGRPFVNGFGQALAAGFYQ